MLTYITGGVRSGKSAFAEKLAAAQNGSVLYTAFGVVTDEEMKIRIDKHRQRRPNDWGVLEQPNQLLHPYTVYQGYDVILVDCLSTWLANRCMQIPEDQLKDESHKNRIIDEVQGWVGSIRHLQQHIIVVSSEVGLGGVALYPLGRLFQDTLGEANQLVAQAADEAYAVLSGLPVRLR